MLYGLAYLVMFAIPLAGNRGRGIQPPDRAQVAARSWGFRRATLLFVVLSIFPVIEVHNPASYAWKTVVVGVNILLLILYAGRKKTS